MYVSWLELPTSDRIKEWYSKKDQTPTVTKDDAVHFKKLGYTANQIKRIKEQLKNAGYS